MKKSLSSLLALFMVCVTLVWIPVAAHASTELDSVVDDDGNLTIGTLEEYQAEIRARGLENSTASQLAEESNELLVLRTGLVEQVGYDTIMDVAQNYEGGNETLIWLMSDIDALRDYVTGGSPNHNNYTKSLQALSDLYTGSKTITCDGNDTSACDGATTKTYYFKDDLESTEATQVIEGTNNNTTLGDVYRTLMIATSLTHDGKVGFWHNWVEMSTAVDRYWVLRTFRSDPEKYDYAAQTFDSLTVPEMRMITGAWISDRQLAWLNWYRRTNNYSNTYSWQYFSYTSGYNYGNGKYYSEENRQTWEDKYSLTTWNDDDPLLADYDLNYGYVNGSKETQPWIVFEEGGVCGAQAKTTQNLQASAGYPSIVTTQPAHAAAVLYRIDTSGDYVGQARWETWNFITGGWEKSGINLTNDGYRVSLLGWGSGKSGWMLSYTALAQAALNAGEKHGEDYFLVSEMQIVAAAYDAGSVEQLQVLEAAFEIQPFNWDTVRDLESAYQTSLNSGDITLDDFADMAVEIIEGLTYYPLAMWQLTAQHSPNLLGIVGTSNSEQWTRIYDAAINAFEAAKNATYDDVMQISPPQNVATFFLNGNTHNDGSTPKYVFPFTFAFASDGTATLTPQSVTTNGKTLNWTSATGQYSVDGGTTWYDFQGTTTIPAEIADQITAENDFLVKFSEERTWSVDITGSPTAPTTSDIYANDRENKVFGDLSDKEYSVDGGATWIAFNGESPVFEGDQTVQIRTMRGTTEVSASSALTVEFTEDDDTPEYTYIPLSSISYHSSSSARNEWPVENFIDGDLNTVWTTLFRNNDTNGRYYVVELDQPRVVSRIEYYAGAQVKKDSYNYASNYVTNLTVYVSMDGTNWTQVGSASGWSTNATEAQKPKTIDLIPTEAKYVKVQNVDQSGSEGFQGAILNIFEQVSSTEYDSVEVSAQTDSEYNAYVYTPTALQTYDFYSVPLGYYSELVDVQDSAGTIGSLRYGTFGSATLEAVTDAEYVEALLAIGNTASGNNYTSLQEVISWLQTGGDTAEAAFIEAAAAYDWSSVSGGTSWSYSNSGDWSGSRAYTPDTDNKALGAGLHLLIDKSGKVEPQLVYTPYTDVTGQLGHTERIYYPVDADGNLLIEVGATASSSQSTWSRTQWGVSLEETTTSGIYLRVVDENSEPISGVSMTLSDNYNNAIYHVTTDSDGYAYIDDVFPIVHGSSRMRALFTVDASSASSLVGSQFYYVLQAYSDYTSGDPNYECDSSGKCLYFYNGWGVSGSSVYAQYQSPNGYVFTLPASNEDDSTVETPANVEVASSENSGEVTVKWETVDSAKEYVVSLYKDGELVQTSTATSNESSFAISGAGAYHATVAAVNDSGLTGEAGVSLIYIVEDESSSWVQATVTIDYSGETLSYSSPEAYTVEINTSEDFTGSVIEADTTSLAAYVGQTLYVRCVNEAGVSNVVAFAIPARPEAPAGISSVDETLGGDGQIINVTTGMEYRLANSGEWTQVTSEQATQGAITDLSAGTYQVRYAATGSAFASATTEVTVAAISGETDNGGSVTPDDGTDGDNTGDNEGGSTGGNNTTDGTDSATPDEGTGSTDSGNTASDGLAVTGSSTVIVLLAVLLVLAGAALLIKRQRAEATQVTQED